MSDLTTSLINTLPKIRGPIQLVGFIFLVLSVFLVNRVDPGNQGSLALVIIFGVSIVVIPLAFHPSLLKHIHIRQRAWFLIAILLMLVVSVGALAYVTVSAVLPTSPEGSRFDLKLTEYRVEPPTNEARENTHRIRLRWLFWPLSAKQDEGATIFVGVVTVHDEDMIEKDGPGRITSMSCSEVPSCLGAYVFNELHQNPILVRSGTKGTEFGTRVNLRRIPKVARVWVEFYQREGLDGQVCGIDHGRDGPGGGLKPLAMFKGGAKVSEKCYRAYDERVLTLSSGNMGGRV
jgi:hypothetical protein